jgi:cyanate lyase
MSASKKRVKSEIIDVLSGGNVSKKAKIQPRDPFADRYADIIVEVPNMCLGEICAKLFGEGVMNPLKFEIKSYKSEYSGVAKTVCGETQFIEESKVSVVITYEKDKKEDLIKVINERFPYCYFH